jgi:allantoicase
MSNEVMTTNEKLHQCFTTNYVDLASERVGGETLYCSDDFFAEMENLLKAGRGIFIDDKYTERGKWMDGWESRRSYGRDDGRQFDWCVIRLGIEGYIRGVDVDTNFFRGNAPQTVSIEACTSAEQPGETTQWHTILQSSEVDAHSQNLFEINSDQAWTHVRLNIFPDGGVARFRVYGEANVKWDDFLPGELIDLAAIKNGGKALLVSDMFFSDKNNLIMPGRGKDMGDGWETKRRRDPGPDWSIVKLAKAGSVNKVIIDTHHFKGNYPDTFKLEGCISQSDDFTDDSNVWLSIIDKTKLYAHREHLFTSEIMADSSQQFSHVRLSIFPDGGVSRMRVFGYCEKEILTLEKLNDMSAARAEKIFMQCCTSAHWVQKLVARRPFSDKDAMLRAADECWQGLGEVDYLQAFEGHPRIGDVSTLRAKYANTKALASGEQSAVNHADEQVLQDLKQANDDYYGEFDFIFIVCATGKSAQQMLSILNERLNNERPTEIIIAAEEQQKIFGIRLEKLL